jgi:hypothetical protein
MIPPIVRKVDKPEGVVSIFALSANASVSQMPMEEVVLDFEGGRTP